MSFQVSFIAGISRSAMEFSEISRLQVQFQCVRSSYSNWIVTAVLSFLAFSFLFSVTHLIRWYGKYSWDLCKWSISRIAHSCTTKLATKDVSRLIELLSLKLVVVVTSLKYSLRPISLGRNDFYGKVRGLFEFAAAQRKNNIKRSHIQGEAIPCKMSETNTNKTNTLCTQILAIEFDFSIENVLHLPLLVHIKHTDYA